MDERADKRLQGTPGGQALVRELGGILGQQHRQPHVDLGRAESRYVTLNQSDNRITNLIFADTPAAVSMGGPVLARVA